MKSFVHLQKLKSGDQVAIVSPSAGLPGLFPWVHELGLERLANNFELVPKEYPTTRIMGATPKDRARDVMAAFADPKNKAVISTIGGEDSIRILRYLDSKVFIDNPKPLFGYSDITHLHNYLWNLGIPSYYGGAIMTQYAMQGSMHSMTEDYLKRALFVGGKTDISFAKEFNDEGLDWADRSNLNKIRKMEPNDNWFWDGQASAEGILWGGCVESLIVQCTTSVYLPKDDDLAGTVLFIETAEDLPDPWIVEYLLMGFGERGWFDKFKAVLVGRPKAWEFDKQNTPEQKAAYRQAQRDTVTKTIRQYNVEIPIVQNIDFGHTDPQIVLPLGRTAQIDPVHHTIKLDYE